MAHPNTEGKESDAVASDEARRNFADLLARAAYKDERIVITMYGKEHAALIGMKDLGRLRALDGE
jgi:prevent-host-death family protein